VDLPTDSPQVHDEVVSALSAAGMHPWVWDICTGRVAWSQEIDAMFGLAKGASVTTYEAYMLSLPSEARPVVEAAIERTLTGLAPEYYVEHRVADLGEAPRWVAGRGRVVRDAEGKPLRLAGVVWDITKRKEAEAGLARVNRQWSMVREIHRQILHTQSQTELFETACHVAVDVGGFRLAWVGLVTPDGARLLPTARRGHDTAVLDALRLDLRSPVPSIDATARAAREGRHIVVNDLGLVHNLPPCMAAAYALGHKSVAALPLRQKERIVGVLTVTSDAVGAFDDEQVDMLVSLVNDLGHVLGVLDGEEQRRATEAALRSSEERYRSVFQQAFEGIFIVARSHAIVDANESSCRMLGYTREEMLQLSAEDVIHPEEFARVPIRFASIPAGGVILSERRFVRKDGSVMQGELSTKALLDGNFQVVVRDVTNRKQVQGQMLLTDRLSSLGRLASGVAHEINNPLAYVMLNLEMVSGWLRRLEHPNDPEAVVRLLAGLDDARDGAERMRRIVR
jgi:PAS domain S-box-containing protein